MARALINAAHVLATFAELAVIYGPSRKERAVADYIKKRLGGLWTVAEDGAGRVFGGDAGNILVRIPGRGEPLVFCAHMDTVEPCRGVTVKIKKGYFTSGGDTILGADDRAAVAVLLELALAAGRIPGRRPLELLFTVAEEVGLLGAQRVDIKNIRGRTVFVFDASEAPGTLVTSAPGSDLFAAAFYGRAAHAGVEPEKGRSAVQMAAAAVAAMKLGRIDFETTANVGVINGGRARNIIPDHVELNGEVRSRNKAKLARHGAHVTRALKKGAAAFGGRVRINWEHAYDAYHFDDDAPPLQLFRRAARATGLRARLVGGGGGSDANIFNARGLAAVVVGCGMERPHSTDERIAVTSLRRLAELATALAAG